MKRSRPGKQSSSSSSSRLAPVQGDGDQGEGHDSAHHRRPKRSLDDHGERNGATAKFGHHHDDEEEEVDPADEDAHEHDDEDEDKVNEEEDEVNDGEIEEDEIDGDADQEGDSQHEDFEEIDQLRLERNEDGQETALPDEEGEKEVEPGSGSNDNWPRKKVHRLSLTATQDFNAQLQRRGVLYLARVPPRMTPTKIKHLLQQVGATVTRVYLVPEDAAARKRRRQTTGQARHARYIEGWVELSCKKMAKHVAASLNNTAMSHYKRDVHYGDLWNLKYLSRFTWSHLTEKVAYERRVREQKLRLETMQAQRETAAYKQLVATGQKMDKIQQRLERQRAKRTPTTTGTTEAPSTFPARPLPTQRRPLQEGTDRPTKKALLGSLV